MHIVTRNRFPILKNLLIDSDSNFLETSVLNIYMCKFESSQKDENRDKLAESSKA